MNDYLKRALIPGYGVKKMVDQRKANAAAQEEAHGSLLLHERVTGIKVYADGTLVSKHGNGSIIGATARVDKSGSKRLVRDTRQTYLIIEGPHVGIAVHIAAN
jgi:hypothetical protein